MTVPLPLILTPAIRRLIQARTMEQRPDDVARMTLLGGQGAALGGGPPIPAGATPPVMPAAQSRMTPFDKIQDALAPVDAGLHGLLSEDDVKKARQQGLFAAGAALLDASGPSTTPTSLGQALGRGLQAGISGYNNAVDRQVQSIGQRQAIDLGKLKVRGAQQEMDTEAKRQAILSQIPQPQDPNDPHAMAGWAHQASAALLKAGLTKDAADFLQAAKSLEDRTNLQAVQAGDAIYTFDPRTGTYTKGPDRGVPADQLELRRLQLQEQRARTQAMVGVANERSLRTQTNGFMNRNKVLADRAATLNQAITTLSDAQHDPVLYSSAIANFIQSADQKAQLRIEMLRFFKDNVDPSVAGKWNVLRSRILEGKLPQYASSSMIRHLEKLRAQAQHEWDTKRAGEVKRHPDLDGWIPPGEEMFAAPEEGHGASDLSPEGLTGTYGGLQ